MVEIRTLKWPRRPQTAALTLDLGEDMYGRWFGVAEGDPWWSADGRRAGTFESAIVKLVPSHTFWTVCFRPSDPVVDVDIVLPPVMTGDVLEEVDLELDILRDSDGRVYTRDEDEFDLVRERWPMPGAIVSAALEIFERLQALVQRRAEPFGDVGSTQLSRFMGYVDHCT